MSESPKDALDEGAGKPNPSSVGSQAPAPQVQAAPLVLVETAFLASTTSLIWLVNAYFPPGPLLRIFFPVPIALAYLRWGHRAAWMSALVSGLLLSVLMGPPRSIQFFIPFGLLGVLLGACWRRRTSWSVSIALGTLLGTIGFFFRFWLLSIMLGEDLWVYGITQVSNLLDWVFLQLGLLIEPDLILVNAIALLIVVLSNLAYLFVVHIASWLLLERLGNSIPQPPQLVAGNARLRRVRGSRGAYERGSL